MSTGAQVDYDALAAKYGGRATSGNYDDLAAKYGGAKVVPSDSLVTGKGMEQYAQKQAAAAVRGPLDNAVSPGQRAPGEKTNPVSRFAEITTGSPHPLDALTGGDLPAIATAPGRYAKSLAAAEIKAPARLAYSSVTHPIDTAVSLTGGPQFSADIHNGRYGNAVADVLGGVANAYGILRGAESLPKPELPFELPSKEGIAATFRTEKNALKPGVKAVGKLGGAATGGLIGHVAGPYGGYIGSGVGALAGPTILDAIIPNRPKAMELPSPELGSPNRIPKRLPTTFTLAANVPERQAAIPRVATPTPEAVFNIPQRLPEEGIKGSVPKPSGRLVLTPDEATAQAQMQRIAKNRASQHGMLYAAGMRPAGGGRVPLMPTRIETFEYPGPRVASPLSDEEKELALRPRYRNAAD